MDGLRDTETKERLEMCILIFDPALAIENLLGDLLAFAFVGGAIWAIVGFLSRKSRKP